MYWSLIVAICILIAVVIWAFLIFRHRKIDAKKEREEILRLGGTLEKTIELLNESISRKKEEQEQYSKAYEKYEKLDEEIIELELKIAKLQPKKRKFVIRL